MESQKREGESGIKKMLKGSKHENNIQLKWNGRMAARNKVGKSVS